MLISDGHFVQCNPADFFMDVISGKVVPQGRDLGSDEEVTDTDDSEEHLVPHSSSEEGTPVDNSRPSNGSYLLDQTATAGVSEDKLIRYIVNSWKKKAHTYKPDTSVRLLPLFHSLFNKTESSITTLYIFSLQREETSYADRSSAKRKQASFFSQMWYCLHRSLVQRAR